MSPEERIALERRLNRFGLSAQPIAQTTDETALTQPVSTLTRRFWTEQYRLGHADTLPSVSTLRRLIRRSLDLQQEPGAGILRPPRARSSCASTRKLPALRIPIADPAKGLRRPIARPVLYVDVYSGALFIR